MNGLGGEDALILAYDYTEKSLEGTGALKGQDGKDGVSPIISVNTSTEDTYKLDITDKNGTITTPNLVGKQGLQGIQGEQGKPADNPIITENADNTEDVYKLDLTVGETVFTTKNIIGKQGLEGVSPSVTTSPDNTAEDYRLNITTKGGTFTTPNLRGPQGEQGPQGESAASAINPRGDYDVNADPHYAISDYITSAEGNTYVCKKDNPNNVAPTDGTVNDEFWQVLALRGAKGESGKDGEKGSDGVTFTPSIDENGVLSFTNNGGLENPEPIDIKGDNGVTFTPSIDTYGYLSFTNNGNLENPEPIKVLGKDGEDGKDGIDGTTYIPSIGTVTTVESNADASAGVTVDEETKEAVFNFAIPKGENGADGFSPVVTVTDIEGGHNVAIEDVNGVQNFEVSDGKGIITSLEELGLTAPTTVGEAFMAMPNKSMLMLNVEAYAEKDGNLPTVTDIPAEYGVLTIDKWSNSRFRIEFNNSLGGSSTTVKQWIGTLKGSDGTGLKWKQINTGNHKYITMGELGLEGATATIQDVMDKVAVGDSVMLRTDAFNENNWNTQCNGIQWGYLKIEKTMNGLSNIELQEVVVPNRRYFGTQSSGKFVGWVQMNKVDGTEITQSIIDTYGTEILKYPIGKWRISNINLGNQLTDLPRTSTGAIITIESIYPTKSPWTDNWSYRQYKFESSMEDWVYIRTLNSGDTAGVLQRDSGWKKMIVEKSSADPYSCSGYTALTGTEDLFTLPCGHYVSANINTTYNYPITDTNTTAHIYVLGCLNDPTNNKGYRIILYFDNKGRAYRINEWWGVFTDNRWQEIAKKSIYNSVAELNRAKGTNIELVNGEDNTKKIVDALSVGEQFISFYHNNANQNRFGIDTVYGSLINELRITKCLDADLTANYATVTAFMNTGCVMSRIYYKTYSTDWSSTKDYVESLK